jgi:hypothetical protein
VLGPLFTVFIDYVDEYVVDSTNIIKFADNTRSWKVIESDRDRAEWQAVQRVNMYMGHELQCE